MVAWNFGIGPQYCKNCKLSCHNCEKAKQPKTLEGLKAWEIIKSIAYQIGDSFPMLEALELAKLEGLDLFFAKDYFLAASKGLRLAQIELNKSN